MTMIAGSVSIADDGTETTSGMAASIYGALKTQQIADLLLYGQAPLTGTAAVTAKRGMASASNAVASGVTSYLLANATAKVGSGIGSLQKTPNPNNPATLTVASGADVFLPIV